MSRIKFIAILVGIFGFTQHVSPFVIDAQAAKAKAKQAVPGEDGCYKKVGVKGRPHKLNTVASLSAVRQWSESAKKHGENYAMWHNASGSSIKCEKLPRSDYYSCFASGKPCPAREMTGAKKTN